MAGTYYRLEFRKQQIITFTEKAIWLHVKCNNLLVHNDSKKRFEERERKEINLWTKQGLELVKPFEMTWSIRRNTLKIKK